MPYLSSVPADAGLLQIFQAYPDPVEPLLDLHERLMRAPSPLTPGERELIAAYVSGLNDCDYCHGVHAATAAAFGIAPEILTAALSDLDSAPVSARMKPLLRYLAKLTRTPAKVTERDARAVLEAGWDDRALHDAVLVCALFNFMNRMVDGLGIAARPDYVQMSGDRLHDIGYAGLAALVAGDRGVIPSES
jgi:uncharacterized peroxidase-related enzyme